jgi:hypothetical protein
MDYSLNSSRLITHPPLPQHKTTLEWSSSYEDEEDSSEEPEVEEVPSLEPDPESDPVSDSELDSSSSPLLLMSSSIASSLGRARSGSRDTVDSQFSAIVVRGAFTSRSAAAEGPCGTVGVEKQ